MAKTDKPMLEASKSSAFQNPKVVMLVAVIISFITGALFGAMLISGMVNIDTGGTPKLDIILKDYNDDVSSEDSSDQDSDVAETEVLPTEECLDRTTISLREESEEPTSEQIQVICNEYTDEDITIQNVSGDFVYGVRVEPESVGGGIFVAKVENGTFYELFSGNGVLVCESFDNQGITPELLGADGCFDNSIKESRDPIE